MNSREVLGGADGKARCQCGRPRYPRYKLCPKCYYKRKDGPKQAQRGSQLKNKERSVAELLELRTPQRMHLSDRHERIRFLQQNYGKKFRGQEIQYMKNPKLYAISEQAGYRRR